MVSKRASFALITLASATLLTFGCSDDDSTPPRSDQAFAQIDAGHDLTPNSCNSGADCAGDEYCFIECLCCGMALPDASTSQPSGRSECRKIPTSCDTNAICGCEALSVGGACDATTRTIEQPCA